MTFNYLWKYSKLSKHYNLPSLVNLIGGILSESSSPDLQKNCKSLQNYRNNANFPAQRWRKYFSNLHGFLSLWPVLFFEIKKKK